MSYEYNGYVYKRGGLESQEGLKHAATETTSSVLQLESQEGLKHCEVSQVPQSPVQE